MRYLFIILFNFCALAKLNEIVDKSLGRYITVGLKTMASTKLYLRPFNGNMVISYNNRNVVIKDREEN